MVTDSGRRLKPGFPLQTIGHVNRTPAAAYNAAAMLTPTPALVRLADYRPPAFLIPEIALDFDLRADYTEVTARLTCRRNPAAEAPDAPLILDGDTLQLVGISLDGRALTAEEYALSDTSLVLPHAPDHCVVETRVRIEPEHNTQLMGLFASRNGYFTQCEAEGFRRITFFADRPDVLSRYTTTIHADRTRFPVLLSNGNRTAVGGDGEHRHWARWVDPFPKPSYLFALVAAQLDMLHDTYVTCSGRRVDLFVYVEPGRLDQCGFALAALKSAMAWDEAVYGRELDLDLYMIVAVSDFNMGAMENKGLNIFNTKYVLARADLATDHDFMMLDRVVAHEYFHNWTGNRVTCRDWFQLSLKEGLTVFRDQQYGGDRYSHAVQRIQEVRDLRAAQFPEDAGPMAHPVRPAAYMEISNFYTATVYNKGAEVVRMIHTLLGPAAFRHGMDLYFSRHDGEAVCTEDFVRAMQDASGIDLTRMQRWYDQAGTPIVTAAAHYDHENARYTLEFAQRCAPTPGQPEKAPFPIPIALGLLDHDGAELPLVTAGDDTQPTTRVCLLTETTQRFTFERIAHAPVPSLLRGFSAPVTLRFAYSDEELALLMAHDTDAFNRWEAGQRLALGALLGAIADLQAGRAPAFAPALLGACERLLMTADADPAFAAEALTLPGASHIAEQMDVIDPDTILAARIALRRELATGLRRALRDTYARMVTAGTYSPEPAAAGRRALRNVCLGYLMEIDDPALRALCSAQLDSADNMTDALAALGALANTDCVERPLALATFYARWQHEPLVVDKWFAVQATSRLPGTLAEVRALAQHPAFELTNPNRVRALVGSFCHGNHAGFHAADGGGYEFAAEQIIALDPLNPQVAARLARAYDRWRKFDAMRLAAARRALERIRDTPGLSKDTTEVITRALT